MNKIFFYTNYLHMGGVETALIDLLKSIPSKERQNISVHCLRDGGELYDKVKSLAEIKIIPCTISKIDVINAVKEGNLFRAFKIVFTRLCISTKKKIVQRRMIEKDQVHPIQEQCDIAVAYHIPFSLVPIYVAYNVTAKRKILWIHNDPLTEKPGDDSFLDCFDKFDEIICVSESAKRSFLSLYPSLQNRTKVIYNIVDCEKICRLAKEEFSIPSEGTSICTVGRLNSSKGYLLAIDACDILVKNGYPIYWYICGEGAQRYILEERIRAKNLQSHIFLVGNQDNPYKYINACDIYVQTSLTEGYCLTLAEARVLRKPIVTTNFQCASEHIKSGYNGLIVEKNAIEIARGIETLIVNPNLRKLYSENQSLQINDEAKKQVAQLFMTKAIQ